MSIEFDQNRMEKARGDMRKWWNGELDRPLIQVHLEGRDPERPEPAIPKRILPMSYGLSVSPEQIVDRWDYDLSRLKFLGDAVPYARPLYGSSAMAVFINTRFEVDKDTIWYFPWEEQDVTKIKIEYVSDNVWFQRIKEIYHAAIDRWQGSVQVGITNLGGIYDILTMIMPPEKVLTELYDHPEDMKRLTWEAYNVWWQYMEELNSIIQPVNRSYVDFWLPILCDEPAFTLQSDFCCMVGPGMFDEFIKPELAASCSRLGGSIFHLDGPDALRHLDSLLAIPELKGVQWIPGDGAPDVTKWPEVHKKIQEAGKLNMLLGSNNMEDLDIVCDQLGSAKGIIYPAIGAIDQEDEFSSWLEKYGVEP